MHFSIDFGDWDRDALPFDSTDAVLEFYLEKARGGESGETVPELSKMPVFRGVFRPAMCLASAQEMKLEAVFVKNMLAMLRLSGEMLSCPEGYNDQTRKDFLELVGQARDFCISPHERGVCLELYYDLSKKSSRTSVRELFSYSTVTDFARLRGLSMSQPRCKAT